MFGPKRAHVLSIFDNFLKDFGLLAATMILGLVTGDFSLVTDNIPILIIVVIGPFLRLKGYLFTRYSIDATRLVQEKSFIYRSYLEIPLSTITTVDVSQNFLQQIFGIYALHIDNASNISDTSSKINVTFGREDMQMVKELLIKGRDGMDGLNPFAEEAVLPEMAEKKVIRVSPVQIILYGLLETKGVAVIELFGVLGFFSAFINMSNNELDSVFDRFLAIFDSSGIVLAGIAVIIIILLVVTAIAAVKSFISYYDFTMRDNGKALKISYGILKKKNYTIQKNRITGFSYEQSFLMRLFNVGVLKVFAIGYGGTDDQESYEEPLIYPLLKEDALYYSMKAIMPEIGSDYAYIKPKKQALRYFFYNLGLSVSVLIQIGLIIVADNIAKFDHVWIFGTLLLVIAIVNVILRYKNSGICGDCDTISLSYGGFRRSTIFIKTNSVESVELSTSYFKRKKGIGHITIGHIAPLVTATHSADNLSVEAYNHIKKLLIY